MKQIEWNIQFSVGVPELDKQHIRLFELANRLAKHLHHADAKKIIDETIRDLKAYTDTHFKFEEAILEKAHYESLEEHRKIHALMRTRLDLFIAQMQQGFFDKSEFAEFVEHWLTLHILGEDMKYIPAVLALSEPG